MYVLADLVRVLLQWIAVMTVPGSLVSSHSARTTLETMEFRKKSHKI